MTQKLKVRSSMEICDDIAAVLEKADPGYYWPEKHHENVKEANEFLCGRRLTTPKAYLSSIRRKAVEAGYSVEIKPLITEARRLLTFLEPHREKRPHRADLGR